MRIGKVCALVVFAACTGNPLLAPSADFGGASDVLGEVQDNDTEDYSGVDVVDDSTLPPVDEPKGDVLDDDAEDDVVGSADLEDAKVLDSDSLYDPERLIVYKFTFDTDAEERLRAQPREYVPAELELVDGSVSERMEVGLRLKGEGTFRTLAGKAAFRIKIDEYHRGQRLRGVRALTLNNMLQDSSQLAERLAYHLFRELGVPASRANHAMVYVNGVYYGLYANLETPNEEFLERWFADPNRNLYEEAGRDFDDRGGAQSFELETNEKKPDSRERLVALEAACTAGNLPRARELVDWPRFLLFAALEAALNQVDGYSLGQSGPNNYRIYDSEAGIVFIPWGLDWAFGPVATQDGGLYVDPFWVLPQHGVLKRMCLADQECTEEYSDAVKLVASRWESLHLEEPLERWTAQAQLAIETDQRREAPFEETLSDRDIMREFIRERPRTLLEAVERHKSQRGPAH